MYFTSDQQFKTGISVTAITEEEVSIMQCKSFVIYEDRDKCIELSRGTKKGLFLYRVEPLRDSYLRYIGDGRYLADGVRIIDQEQPIVSYKNEYN